jgi:regulator of protease activity HflC (stomatin/prohibitin superfamily)
MLSPFTVFVILIVVFAIIFVGLAVKSVPQGYEWTVERLVAMSVHWSPALPF